MKKKRVLILGAGISGLSTAFSLRKTHDVVVLEQAGRAGGWLETVDSCGYLFESGPRTFRSGNSPHLLVLVKELGLEKEIIFSNEEAKRRFLLFQGHLEKVPNHPLSLFRSPLMKGIRKMLLTEWCRSCVQEDETLWQFAERRFGKKAAERFFDPLALGIYAASSKSISVDACFPRLKEMERNHGSITKALLSSLRNKKKGDKPSLFSFRHGVQTLVNALQKELQNSIYLEHSVQAIFLQENAVRVVTSQGVFEGDVLISALPPRTIGKLLAEVSPKASYLLQNIAMTSLTMVQLGYQGDFLEKKGFGYLVPTAEELPLLGVVFDSSVFPEHNRGEQTRLTVMLPPTEQTSSAIKMVERHLGLTKQPDFMKVRQCVGAIPLPEIGHQQRISKISEILELEAPNILLAGNYLNGVSVNDCIHSAVSAAKKV